MPRSLCTAATAVTGVPAWHAVNAAHAPRRDGWQGVEARAKHQRCTGWPVGTSKVTLKGAHLLLAPRPHRAAVAAGTVIRNGAQSTLPTLRGVTTGMELKLALST